jgi:hypothetical protein
MRRPIEAILMRRSTVLAFPPQLVFPVLAVAVISEEEKRFRILAMLEK